VGVLGAVSEAGDTVRDAAGVVGGNRSFRAVARAGLVARAAFYLLLAGLAVDLAVTRGHSGRQANAHGALSVVASSPWGLAAIVAAGVGFLVFGVARLVGVVRDHGLPNWRRATTALQGLFYVALTWVPVSFALGRRTTGSEQSQHAETARVLAWPGGRALVVAAGLIAMAVCGWQIRTAATGDFTDGMALEKAPRWACRLVTCTGVVGIAARALVFLPVGAFLVVAGVQADPRHANGLDAELATLAGTAWGPFALAAVALGLTIFAAYSLLEARYREVARGK